MDSLDFADQARRLGVELAPAQAAAFETYYRELVTWNARVNLTSIVERQEVYVKHFLDSLSVALAFGANPPRRLIDIGSGAGFPGLPLKIAHPEIQVTLLEATGKKVEFLRQLIATLGREADARHARAEELGRDADHREKYDLAAARAVAELCTLLELALPFVSVGGLFVAQKGIDVDEEVQRAEAAASALGGRLRQVIPVQLPGLEQRHLVVYQKVSPTPSKYPRRPGVPEKKPVLASAPARR